MHVINGTKSVINYSDGVFFSELYISCLREYFLEVGVDEVKNDEQMVLNLILGGGDDIENLAGKDVLFLTS